MYVSQREPSCQQARLPLVLGSLLLLQAQQMLQGCGPGGALCLSHTPDGSPCCLCPAQQTCSLAGGLQEGVRAADGKQTLLHVLPKGVCSPQPAVLLKAKHSLRQAGSVPARGLAGKVVVTDATACSATAWRVSG